jgi:hypothetical protein
MDRNGGEDKNDLNDASFLSIDHGSPVEQPVDPVKDVNPVDIYAPEIASDSPNIASLVSDSVANEIAKEDSEIKQPAEMATESTQSINSDSNVQTTQATAYDYSNAFGIAATDDTNTIKKAGSATDMSGFEGNTETPQFFSEAMENAITSGKPAKKERKSRTARKESVESSSVITPVANTEVTTLQAAHPERHGGKIKLIAIIAALLIVAGGIILALNLTGGTVFHNRDDLSKELRELGNLIIYGEEKDDELPDLSDMNPYFEGMYNNDGHFDAEKLDKIIEKSNKVMSDIKDESIKDKYISVDAVISVMKDLSEVDNLNNNKKMLELLYMVGEGSLESEINKTFDGFLNSANKYKAPSLSEAMRAEAIMRAKTVIMYENAGCFVDSILDSNCANGVAAENNGMTLGRLKSNTENRKKDATIRLIENIAEIITEVDNK